MAFTIKRVSAKDVPQTAQRAGRKRTPTDFDEHMKIYNSADWTDSVGNVEWDGWNEVQADSDKQLTLMGSQLTSAANHFDVGIERRVDQMALTLWFRVKPRTYKPRKPKSDDGVEIGHASSAEGTVARGGTVHHLDSENETSDSETPKRQRKAS